MSVFSYIITQILYRPIYNILIIFLAIFGGNLGISIILLTLCVRGIMIKSSLKSASMSKGMSNLQPKIEALQKKYENDPQKLSEETLKLFKTEGKAPFKGCLTMLVQLPVFIGLYYVVRSIAGGEEGIVPGDWLYSFFRSFGERYQDIEQIETNFLGIDLLANHNRVLTIIVAVLNYTQMKLTQLVQPKKAPTKGPNGEMLPDPTKMMGVMSLWMALMMGFLVYGLNSWVGLYLLTTSCFSVIQYTIQYRAVIKTKRNARFWNKNEPVIIEPEK